MFSAPLHALLNKFCDATMRCYCFHIIACTCVTLKSFFLILNTLNEASKKWWKVVNFNVQNVQFSYFNVGFNLEPENVEVKITCMSGKHRNIALKIQENLNKNLHRFLIFQFSLKKHILLLPQSGWHARYWMATNESMEQQQGEHNSYPWLCWWRWCPADGNFTRCLYGPRRVQRVCCRLVAAQSTAVLVRPKLWDLLME